MAADGICVCFFFFFSSRRRHTRSLCDWSSDVCSSDLAIVGFPKFGTIGIGFAQEEDWNTNLPYTCPTQQIYDHIKHNKKYDEIADDTCVEAIRLIQEAAKSLK